MAINPNYEKNINLSEKNAPNDKKITNYIIATIEIKNDNLNQRIINSYENAKREEKNYLDFDEIKEIENEDIISDCEIYINDKKIDFDYYYDFPKEGNYIIKYIFKKELLSTNFMFYNCYSIKTLDLSNINTKNVTNMEYMFNNCNSLISIDLSNINTENVTNMEFMFCKCNSLKAIDLSNFNTHKVTNMEYMFCDCSSLKTLNLI